MRRFPHSISVEGITWKHFDALNKAGRSAEARRAAQEYLKTYPHGMYVELASRLAAQK